MIPYGKQDINKDDVAAVIKVLQSDFLTQGPQVPLFEDTVSSYCGAEYGVAVNSATSALHIACLALGLHEGDYLWTSPNTFVASANCGLYCGATIDFVDIDTETYNMSADALEEKLIDARVKNTLPTIVVPVHFAGQSCDMRRIYQLSQEYDFKIIEDASHAIGGKYLGTSIGGCKYSDITIFSFHPVKIITSCEGGMALTNDTALATRMCSLRSHGVTSIPTDMDARPVTEIWNYQQVGLGFNYRMTDLQAALGVSQMQRLDSFVAKRHALQMRYHDLLEKLPIKLPFQSMDSYSALHLYPLQLELGRLKKTQAQIYEELRMEGIGINLHYIPVHLQPFYQSKGFKYGDFPNAESYFRRAISIPLFYGLSFDMQDKVVEALETVLL